MGQRATRESDERLLGMVLAREEGSHPSEIGAVYGLSADYVARMTNAVKQEDIRYAGREETAGYYW